tara:strand:+ start:439 stop:786 length:348 start_codon:yes stop_codon:yes gene_type:complete
MKKFNYTKWVTENKHGKFLLKEEEEKKLDTKTMSGLADYFLLVSKALRKGEYKGLQATEINEIDDLVKLVLQGAMDGNITAVLQRLEVMLAKTVKTPELSDEMPQDEFTDDETEN